MKLVMPALIAAALLVAAPAIAQPGSGHYDAGIAREPETQALAFLRIPFGHETRQRKAPEPMRFGFGLFTACGRVTNELSAPRAAECESRTVRSLELTTGFNAPDWILSFSGSGRNVPIARLNPRIGLSLGGESTPSFVDDSFFRDTTKP